MASRQPDATSSRASREPTSEPSSVIWSNDPAAAPYNPPEPVICEYCGAKRYHRGINLFGRILWPPYAERCTCPGAAAAYEQEKAEREAREAAEKAAAEAERMRKRIQRIVGDSGMGERFLRRTFATFEVTEENHAAQRAAKSYADNFDALLPRPGAPEPGKNGLFIAGPKGTGKTHLAAAIANQLMHGDPPTAVICMTMIDLLERIRRTFGKGDVDEADVLTIYKTVPLLIIDDMGKEPATEWAVSTVYNIINGRYEAYLPTIITTNYDTQALIQRMTPSTTGDPTTAEATIDRLMEMCRGIVMDGQSWRSR